MYVNKCKKDGPEATIEKALLNANSVVTGVAGQTGDLERHLRVASGLSTVIGQPIPQVVIDSMLQTYERLYKTDQ